MNFEQIKSKLHGFSVAIAGAGGLGSNCAMALVRAGVGNLLIADFDVVSESNLNRQFYFANQIGIKKVVALKENLSKIRESAKITAIDKKLVPDDIVSLFGACDIIVEAFDNKVQKQMLIETVIEHLSETPLIVGTGMAGWGDNDSIRTQKIDNIYICGDQETEIADDLPPIAPRVGVVANMQANVVLEILLGKMP